ncbi:MAG: CDP-glucose 4,6-dehydratase [Alphaproteobacteria bacterium]
MVGSAFHSFYKGKRILVTGHTGFKGSWLCHWLLEMGATVTGYALPPEQTPDSLYQLTALPQKIKSHHADIRDFDKLSSVITQSRPEIIFHMAAQALVLPSYEDPLGTFATNIMGTANLLEAARKEGGVRAIVNVTTDKCYENNESGVPFREEDPLGGYDPYSSSKAAAEIVSAAYRRSFLKDAGIQMASVRAGNVIGGGDFSRHRLIPDIIRAAKDNKPVNLRHPQSVRPWQHVLDVLHGYLLVGQKLCDGGEKYAQAYNFGPDTADVTVGEIADILLKHMQYKPAVTRKPEKNVHEACLLNLDNSKAKSMLGWHPVCSAQEAVQRTAQWYDAYLEDSAQAAEITDKQLQAYVTAG